MSDCIFCKIVKGEIPCTKVYEDDNIWLLMTFIRWRRCMLSSFLKIIFLL